MSRASAKVRFPDGTILATLYNGTVDVIWSRLVPTLEDAWGWLYTGWKAKTHSIHAECSCGRDEEVDISTNYGYGTSWKGRACRHCMAILGPLDPFPMVGDEAAPSDWNPFDEED